MNRSLVVVVFLSFVCPLFAQAPVQAPAATPADAPSTIKALVETSRLDELRWPDFSDYRKHMVNFYHPLNWELSWTRGGHFTPHPPTIPTLFDRSTATAINPLYY